MGFINTKKKFFIKREDYSQTDYLQQRFNTEITLDELDGILRLYEYVKSMTKQLPTEIESVIKKIKNIMEK